MQTLLYYIASIIAVICVFSPHEFAHAYAAYKSGDPTAKLMGRMTINPVKHIDPAGFILCAIAGFGWAKPVPVNPSNFHNFKRGMLFTAIAGVAINYIIAFFAYALYALIVYLFNRAVVISSAMIYLRYFTQLVFLLIFTYSLYSVVFNLLPLNPLDGYRVVQSLTREVNPVQRFLRDYGQMILIILIAESFLCNIVARYTPYAEYFNILGYIGWFATEIIGFPIKIAWGWLLRL